MTHKLVKSNAPLGVYAPEWTRNHKWAIRRATSGDHNTIAKSPINCTALSGFRPHLPQRDGHKETLRASFEGNCRKTKSLQDEKIKETLNASLEVRCRETMEIRTTNFQGKLRGRHQDLKPFEQMPSVWTRANRCVVGNWHNKHK